MSLYYDLNPEDTPPKPGEYLVSIGKRGVNSIWQLAAVRQVQHRTVRDYQRFVLDVVLTPGLKPFTEYDSETHQVWVRGEAAHPLVWYPRNKK
jgi:hypothetical protein